MTETPEVEIIPKPFDFSRFTLDAYEDYTAHQYLYDNFYGQSRLYLLAAGEMAKAAKAVGFSGFKQSMKDFVTVENEARRRDLPSKQTMFSNQPLELDCGQWDCDDRGVYRIGRLGGRETACSHPILPVERLRNLDTGEIKIRLAFCRSGQWQSVIMDAATLASTRTITPALASQDISVTSATAPALVDYLSEISDLNRDVIPEQKSIGRLGYIKGLGFAPYLDKIVFDGNEQFKSLFGCIKQSGSQTKWYETALECRKMSVEARIVLAASFASPLLSIVGCLPFFVHQWCVASGTGKTVCLMLAASVWGDPELGAYTQSFNSTQVGQELTACFLHNLPFCLDELQLVRDSKGKCNFDVYGLCQGVGRIRGTRNGGISKVPTWKNCFLTTGETPIYSESSGAGAINRVLNVACDPERPVIKDGQRIANTLKQNYGWAGQMFVDKLYNSEKSDKIQEQVREVYQDFYRELCVGDSTEKQAAAASAILTADLFATTWIFRDDMELSVDEIREYLASKDAVSAGVRAYDYLIDWVAANRAHFITDTGLETGELYGILEDGTAYIIRSTFNNALQAQGFSDKATLSYLKSKGLIDTRGRAFTRPKKLHGIPTECVCLLIKSHDNEPEFDGTPL